MKTNQYAVGQQDAFWLAGISSVVLEAGSQLHLLCQWELCSLGQP